jgi:hypothetical protein
VEQRLLVVPATEVGAFVRLAEWAG